MDKLSSKIIRIIMSKGIRATLTRALNHLQSRYYEWYFDIRTFGELRPDDPGFDNLENFDYCPTDYVSLRKVLRHVNVGEGNDVFLDYGSGMGRALIIAATLPFRKVIGVELSPMLNKIASKNIAIAKKKLACKDIEIVEADAVTYRVPANVTVVFFANPFGKTILARTLDNIEESLALTPRTVTIIYKGPWLFEDAATRRSWLTKRAEFTRLSAQKYVVYESQVVPSQ